MDLYIRNIAVQTMTWVFSLIVFVVLLSAWYTENPLGNLGWLLFFLFYYFPFIFIDVLFFQNYPARRILFSLGVRFIILFTNRIILYTPSFARLDVAYDISTLFDVFSGSIVLFCIYGFFLYLRDAFTRAKGLAG